MITQKMLRALLDYLEDGTLVWKVSQGSRGKVGAAAGCLDEFGYLRIRVCGKTYKAHRLVWLWHHGYLPEHGLDHIDRRRTSDKMRGAKHPSRFYGWTGFHSNFTGGHSYDDRSELA